MATSGLPSGSNALMNSATSNTQTPVNIGMLLSVIAACCVVAFIGCVDLDGIPTPRYTSVSDSLTDIKEFQEAPDDSIFARVNGVEETFASLRLRYDYYNDTIDGAYFVAISIRRGYLGIDRQYGAISLRLDGIRDTGTYYFNAPFTDPPKAGADPGSTPIIAAQYQRQSATGFVETFDTGLHGVTGWVRVKVIDVPDSRLIGTFQFTGYSAVTGDTVAVGEGGFRLYAFKR